MKKVLCFFLAAVLLLTVTACSGKREFDETTLDTADASQSEEVTAEASTTDPTETSLTPEETAEPTTETTTEATTEATTQAVTEESEPTVLSVDSQLALIAESKNQWMRSDEFPSSMMLYAVTDLDQNGRLEIIYGCNMGTGMYTYAEVWQVSEDGKTLEKTDSFEEGYSRVDFFLSQTVAYYDRENDMYYYMFTDEGRSGWMWNGTDKRALWLEDGVLYEQTLASRSCDTDEAYNTVITYYDGLRNPITESEFDTIEERTYGAYEKLNVSILWQNVAWEELETLEGQTLVEKLAESVQGFSLAQ